MYCNAKLEQEKMLLIGAWHWCPGPYCFSKIVQTPFIVEAAPHSGGTPALPCPQQEWCEHCQRQAEWKRQAEETERRRQERIAAERKEAKRAANQRYQQRKREEKAENERRALLGLPALEKPTPQEPPREFEHKGHHFIRGKDEYERPTVTCNICGQIWRRPPEMYCLKKPTFMGWQNMPVNWHTMTQLQRHMKMQARDWKDVDGYVVTMKAAYAIYKIEKCVPIEPKPRKKKASSKK